MPSCPSKSNPGHRTLGTCARDLEVRPYVCLRTLYCVCVYTAVGSGSGVLC